MQFVKANYSFNSKNAIKCALRREQLSASRERDLDTKKEYLQVSEKKQIVKKKYHDKKQYKKQNNLENPTLKIDYQKANFRKILTCSWYIKTAGSKAIKKSRNIQ